MGLGGPWATSTPRMMTLGGAANMLQYGGTQLNTGQQITNAGLAAEGVAGAFFAYLGGNVNQFTPAMPQFRTPLPEFAGPTQILGGFRNQFGTNGTLRGPAALQTLAAYTLGNVDRRLLVNTMVGHGEAAMNWGSEKAGQVVNGITGAIGGGLEKIGQSIELVSPNETTLSPNTSSHIGNSNPNNSTQVGSTPVLGNTTTIPSPQRPQPLTWALPSPPEKPKDNNPASAFFRK